MLRDMLDTRTCPCRGAYYMGKIDFAGYRRRIDAWEYRSKRRDVPRDATELLELVREIELIDRFSVDVSEKDW